MTMIAVRVSVEKKHAWQAHFLNIAPHNIQFSGIQSSIDWEYSKLSRLFCNVCLLFLALFRMLFYAKYILIPRHIIHF
jgi:hypothetical protein